MSAQNCGWWLCANTMHTHFSKDGRTCQVQRMLMHKKLPLACAEGVSSSSAKLKLSDALFACRTFCSYHKFIRHHTGIGNCLHASIQAFSVILCAHVFTYNTWWAVTLIDALLRISSDTWLLNDPCPWAQAFALCPFAPKFTPILLSSCWFCSTWIQTYVSNMPVLARTSAIHWFTCPLAYRTSLLYMCIYMCVCVCVCSCNAHVTGLNIYDAAYQRRGLYLMNGKSA